MNVKEFRRKVRKSREKDLIQEALFLRNVSPIESFEAGLKLNRFALDMAIAGIKKSKPNISDKDLLKELKKIYWLV